MPISWWLFSTKDSLPAVSLIRMQAVRERIVTREGIACCKSAVSGTIPPGAQIDQPRVRILQLASEPERRHRPALRRAPGVVVDDAERCAGIGEGAPDAAQGVGGVPGARAASQRRQPRGAIQIVDR